MGGAYVEGASPLFIKEIKAPSSICVSSDSKLMGVCGSGDFTTRFTCFTGTKVPILTPEELRASGRDRSGALPLAGVFSLLALLVQKYQY